MMVEWANDGLLQANDGKMLVDDGQMLVNDGEMSLWYYTHLIHILYTQGLELCSQDLED